MRSLRSSREPVAIFDFDKTLVKRDSHIPLGTYLARRTGNIYGLASFAVSFLMFKSRLISLRDLKQRFLGAFFNGRSPEALAKRIGEFEKEVLLPLLNQEVYAVFQEHLRRGEPVLVLSSNFDFTLNALPMLRGADIVGTGVFFSSADRTYRLEGPVYSARAKVEKLEQMFGAGIFDRAAFWADAEDALVLARFRDAHLVS
jgi:phosphoserine phosphatase